MSLIWTVMAAASVLFSVFAGTQAQLTTGLLESTEDAVRLCISLCGAICLWNGVNLLLKEAGALRTISRILRPIVRRVFPSSKEAKLEEAICANISANLLGLGNAATAPGIEAARLLSAGKSTAGDELCRLMVINTASIQLIPTTICAVRAGAGADSPFDILPAVWAASVCALAAGLAAARIFEKVWKS